MVRHDFACYRLPEQSRYTLVVQTKGTPLALGSVGELSGKEGFVVAPFVASPEHPVLLLRPDVVEEHEVEGPMALPDDEPDCCARPEEKAAYAADFARFHAEVRSGRVAKLVLSRCTTIDAAGVASPMELFRRACRLYPHQFIALVSLQQTGTWLMATPEVLLDGAAGQWRTMALAGTMQRRQGTEGDGSVVWSGKNVEEQRYVSAYISDTLARYATDIRPHGPYTTKAAHLLHLRTDFAFRLDGRHEVGELLDALHPTPAVCGMPKEAARRFIMDSESVDRRYYSGFCGPLAMQGQTHLYVSLRCMEIGPEELRLYAGGGILPDSTMESEWGETQSKLQTMLRLLTI